jgi:probable biosynthetic protein (TIGR04099 family)
MALPGLPSMDTAHGLPFIATADATNASSVDQAIRVYQAGMPQLSYAGLSENWLLKECGDLHWNRLAHEHGMDKPEFRDMNGRKAYAAFVALNISGAMLDSVGENDPFYIRQAFAPAGRAQFFSRQTVATAAGDVARVDMLSAFVSRRQGRDNRTAGRAALPEAAAARPHSHAQEVGEHARRFDVIARSRRKAMPQRALGPTHADFVFSPCPHNDFNGANFMYFAAFIALADRAEWRHFRPRPLLALVSRQVFYFGNVNVGEDVAVHFLAGEFAADGSLSHRCILFRTEDGAPIAEIFTHKRPARLPDDE